MSRAGGAKVERCSSAAEPSLRYGHKRQHTSQPPSKWQCGTIWGSFAGPGSATRLIAISPATSAPPIVLAAMAIPNSSSTSNNFVLFVPVRRPSLPHGSWPMEAIGNASKPRGS
jgi:hypothetical protein